MQLKVTDEDPILLSPVAIATVRSFFAVRFFSVSIRIPAPDPTFKPTPGVPSIQ